MTHPKDIKISAPEQFALLNDPDFRNQVITRYLQQFLEAEITSFYKQNPINGQAIAESIVTDINPILSKRAWVVSD